MVNDKQEENDGFALPYDVDFEAMEKSLEFIQQERQGISINELFKRIPIKHASIKSNALKMVKFLNLVDASGTTVTLSPLGSKYFFAPLSGRKAFLANNLPKTYKILLTWIKMRPDGMTVREIASSAVDAWGKPPNEKTFKSMLNTFARFGDYIGALTYLKGGIGKCNITDLGKQVLAEGTITSETQKKSELSIAGQSQNNLTTEFLSNAPNVIKIIWKINGEVKPPMEIEVESEDDLEHLDSFKNSYKRRLSKK